MTQALAPCPSCSRHIKTTERTCPFCKGALSESIADAALPGATSRITRAAAFAFTTTLAVAGAAVGSEGCTSGTPVTTGDASDDGSALAPDGNFQPPYGSVPIDASQADTGGLSAAYGGPPIDAGGGD